MRIINGVYASAKVFTTDNPAVMIDDYAAAQIQMICDNEVAKNSKIRVMPDVHPGKYSGRICNQKTATSSITEI